MFITPLEVTAGLGILASSLTFTGAMLALRQKARNDRNEAWWKRAQWAMDLSLHKEAQVRLIGSQAMELLAASPWATAADLDVLDVALVRTLPPAP